MAKIGILVASSNNNLKLGKKFVELAKEQNIETELIDLVSLNLPSYNTIEEEKNGIPQAAKDLSKK